MDIGVKDWLLAFSGVVFIRFLLEAISNPSTSGVIASDPQTLVHYSLFYLVAAMGSIYIIDFFTNKGVKTANFMIFLLCFMWLAPILDIIFSKSKGFKLEYVFDGGLGLIKDFFNFYNPFLSHIATPGIRIELILLFLGMSWFVWQITKNLRKAVTAFVASYIFVFFISTLPGVVYTISSLISGTPIMQRGASLYLTNLIFHSNIVFNSIHATLIPISYDRFIEIGFDKLMSQFYFIFLCALLFLWFWKNKKDALVAILKNSRPERAGHYILLILLGMWFAFVSGFGRVSSWVDILGVICLIISWYSIWIFSVNLNDCEDLSIDKISNRDRPLVQKTVTEKEMSQSALIFLGISLLGSWSVGYYPFFMCLVSIATSYIYSANPLRLKLVPMVSTFLMAVASLASILAGFFFISQNKIFYIFPPLAMLGILVCYTLLFNVKDLKDVEGDKTKGSYTIPVIFGEKMGQKIIGIMFALSFLLLPIFFSDAILYVLSIPASIIGYILITKFPRKEKSFFILYFVYILLGVILYFPF
jgi:4-hydroxybenzoate polyprenyltransferase